MPSTKYEKLLNKMRKQQSLINIVTNSSEWSCDPQSVVSNAIFTPDDIEKITEESKNIRRKVQEILKEKTFLPKLFLSYCGERSCLNKPEDIRLPRTFSDVQKLMLAALSGQPTPYIPEWCTLLRRDNLSRVVMIVVEGVGTTELCNMYSSIAPAGKEKKSLIKLRKRKRKLEDDGVQSSDSGLEMEEPSKKIKTSTNTSSVLKLMEGEKWDPPLWLQNVLPYSGKLFGIQLEVFAVDRPIQELFTAPISQNYLSKLNSDNNSQFSKMFADMQNQPVDDRGLQIKSMFTKEDMFDRTTLLLNMNDMKKFGYPLNIEGCKGYGSEGFINSQIKYKKVTKSSPIYGVDCEMCLTKLGNELSMISIVNEESEVIYTTYVKPPNPILNYMTMYSGVTKQMLEKVTVTLKDVQQALRKLLPSDAILVGHSLNNDLMALKLFHPYVIDTALIFNMSGIRGIMPSLKLCCKLFLNRVIQKSGQLGHDPSEDASGSLQLVKLKLSRDITFGDLQKCNKMPFDEEMYNQTRDELRRAKYQIKNEIRNIKTFPRPKKWWAPEFNRNLFSLTTENEKSTCLLTIGDCGPTYHSYLESSPSTTLSCESKNISELFNSAFEEKYRKYFTVLHIKLEDEVRESEDAWREDTSSKLKILDEKLRYLHKESPQNSLIVTVFTGSPSIVPVERRSNGIVLLDVKGQEKRNFYSFRKI